MPQHHRGYCALMCGDNPATTVVCGYRICDGCVGRIRAIATDAGVVFDQERVSDRPYRSRYLTKAERKLEELQEAREIERARRTA